MQDRAQGVDPGHPAHDMAPKPPGVKKAPAAHDGMAMPGGTGEMPPEKLDAELEFMASSIESVISADSGNVSMATLVKNFQRTLDLFAQVLMTPAFREDRVKLAINKSIEALRRQNDNPKAPGLEANTTPKACVDSSLRRNGSSP